MKKFATLIRSLNEIKIQMNDNDYVEFDPRIPKYKSVLTNIIIFWISIMFIIEIFFSALNSDKLIILLGAKWNEGITRGEYWRFLTCTFLHGNLMHLFLNLAAIYIFGKEVESIYGTFRFLIIYLLSSWGAGLASYSFSDGIAIGASGVVFGIIGSLIIFFFRQREKVTGANLKFKSMYTLVIINLLFGFLLPRIDNYAHMGGLVTGLIIGWFISPEYKIEKVEELEKLIIVRKKDLSRFLFGTLIVICLLLGITKTATSIQFPKTSLYQNANLSSIH